MLKDEFKFYLENQSEFVQKYEGKFIVIKDQKIIGVYDDEPTAYHKTKKEYELGTFLIQQCLPGEDSYTQTFHSRVIFA